MARVLRIGVGTYQAVLGMKNTRQKKGVINTSPHPYNPQSEGVRYEPARPIRRGYEAVRSPSYLGRWVFLFENAISGCTGGENIIGTGK